MAAASAHVAMPTRRLNCERCGADFVCGAGDNGTCWCLAEPFRLPMPSAAGGDCLCPACLRVAAATMEEPA
jgi:uncharacterized protein